MKHIPTHILNVCSNNPNVYPQLNGIDKEILHIHRIEYHSLWKAASKMAPSHLSFLILFTALGNPLPLSYFFLTNKISH